MRRHFLPGTIATVPQILLTRPRYWNETSHEEHYRDTRERLASHCGVVVQREPRSSGISLVHHAPDLTIEELESAASLVLSLAAPIVERVFGVSKSLLDVPVGDATAGFDAERIKRERTLAVAPKRLLDTLVAKSSIDGPITLRVELDGHASCEGYHRSVRITADALRLFEDERQLMAILARQVAALEAGDFLVNLEIRSAFEAIREDLGELDDARENRYWTLARLAAFAVRRAQAFAGDRRAVELLSAVGSDKEALGEALLHMGDFRWRSEIPHPVPSTHLRLAAIGLNWSM